MLKLGTLSKWAGRIMLFLLAAQHLGTNNRDSQLIIATASILCCSGLVLPSFTEYLVFALTIPYIRPLRIYLSSDKGMDSDDFQQVIFQHTLLLALAISVSWTVHSDSRRDWLRSPVSFIGNRGSVSITGQRRLRASLASGRSSSHDFESDGNAASASADWNAINDNYFSKSDLQELCAIVLEVRSTDLEFTYSLAPLCHARAIPSLCTRFKSKIAARNEWLLLYRQKYVQVLISGRPRQERSALKERTRAPEDRVMKWHRSNTIIGAGPAGYVYQVQSCL